MSFCINYSENIPSQSQAMHSDALLDSYSYSTQSTSTMLFARSTMRIAPFTSFSSPIISRINRTPSCTSIRLTFLKIALPSFFLITVAKHIINYASFICSFTWVRARLNRIFAFWKSATPSRIVLAASKISIFSKLSAN